MVCNQCGTQLGTDAKSCPSCGKAVEVAADTQSADESTTSLGRLVPMSARGSQSSTTNEQPGIPPAENFNPSAPEVKPVEPASTPAVVTPESVGGLVITGTSPSEASPDQNGPVKLLGVKELLKRAWSIYTSRFRVIILLQLLGVLPVIVLTILIGLIGDADSETPTAIAVGITMLIGFIPAVIWWLWIQAAVIAAVGSAEPLTIKSALGVAWHRLLAYFAVGLLTAVAIILGLIALIVPAIILSVYLAFGTYATVLDKHGPIQALRTSKEYVKGRWLLVAVRFILYGLITLLAYIPVIILSFVMGILAGEVVSSMINSLAAVFIAPFGVAYGYSLYANLKEAYGKEVIAEKTRKLYIVLVVIVVMLPIAGLFSSVVLVALGSARAKARDAQRVADVRLIGVGLESYYVQRNSYPVNLSDLVPNYLDSVPTAPTPPDGDCTDISNKYTYSYVSSNEFFLRFCLGSDTGGLSAGVHTLSSNGFQIRD
ncbi:MAG TPA: hypothetical protein PKD79_03030 [Candidatus Doudnabacteria bacterium]|nr:hypothetical protein [Candidatus Doudnabacteria bacterium]